LQQRKYKLNACLVVNKQKTLTGSVPVEVDDLSQDVKTVRHRGMSLLGPAAQGPGREPATGLSVSSGPVTLDIRPLSAYQQELMSTVLSLRSRGWGDRQIANHFNETGYLTPRGCKWVPQSVFSMRKKYEWRSDRLGGYW
jgi:hypothetical protein